MEEESKGGKRQANKSEDGGESEEVASLGRRSSKSSSSSKCRRYSLVQVKSVKSGDGDSNDDIYQYYLIDKKKKIKMRSSASSRGSAAGQSQMDVEEPLSKKFSGNGKLLMHDCECEDENCLAYHCSCYNEPNQMCLANACCPNCIKMKQANGQEQYKKTNKAIPSKCICFSAAQKTGNKNIVCTCGAQQRLKQWVEEPYTKNHGVKILNSLKVHKGGSGVVVCSCKKSHCLKKYCACYSTLKRCSPQCQCQECQNHNGAGDPEQDVHDEEKGAQIKSESEGMGELDIGQFLQEKSYENELMPMSMQFELPDLKNAYHI